MKKIPAEKPARTWQPLRILSIAGSDSGGGAGLQADIKTVSSLGGYSATAVSAVTVQNTLGVHDVMPLSVPVVCRQVEAVCSDIDPDAVKISMLPDPDLAEPLAGILKKYACRNIVIDPVIVATSGHSLVELPGVNSLVKHLFPLADIVTPNLEEIRVLTGIEPKTSRDYEQAAKMVLDMGASAVLIKGGHAKGKKMNDFLLSKAAHYTPVTFASPRVVSQNLHGTGCTLSAAIAFYLASGMDTVQAVSNAKEYIYRAIKTGKNMQVGKGYGPVNHFFEPVPCKKGKTKQ